jgi:hypothetical protein
MSAVEVIEQIKGLPPEERVQVIEFVRQLETEAPPQPPAVRYATPEQARAAGDQVVKQYKKVFEKLAH